LLFNITDRSAQKSFNVYGIYWLPGPNFCSIRSLLDGAIIVPRGAAIHAP
jgi:hypothetical protein